MNPVIPALTGLQRAALVRAARRSLGHMEGELERLQHLIDRRVKGAEIAAEIVQLEYQVLTEALRKLWRDTMEAGQMSDSYTETDRLNAMSLAMQLYRECLAEPETSLAAYGVAVAVTANVLRVSLKEAALIVNVEVERLGTG